MWAKNFGGGFPHVCNTLHFFRSTMNSDPRGGGWLVLSRSFTGTISTRYSDSEWTRSLGFGLELESSMKKRTG